MSRTLYPLSLDLQDRSVLVVGGGSVAARKLSELLRCGAKVTVIATEPSAGVERLASGLTLLRRPFAAGDERGHYLVFACTDDTGLNQNIGELCRQGSILCNLADSGARSSFHVPGVIRKGQVTVTVSSGGAAPGLTRHLKSQLSEALGDEVAELTLLLAHFRLALKSGARAAQAREIMEALPYRKLLELQKQEGAGAVEAYLQNVESQGGQAEMPSQPALERVLKPVALIGAGPGHPGLLTMMAADALRKADVIIHDRLIPDATLQLAPADCLIIAAGKRGHNGCGESVRQEQIEEQLIEHALQGRRVVRLKGGDPFVYGRGWEEVMALEARQIPWTMIPGVSSTTAAPGWAGIPLTHRGVARSYAVMSGMTHADTNTEIPKADTVVLVMGLHRLGEIIPAFIAQGWRAETPVAAIQSATQPDQRVCFSTLAEIGAETTRLGFDSPTLLVIGEVVGLARNAAKPGL